MRLRLLVPRGGRGRSLGGLAAGLAAVALVLVLVTGDDERRPPRPAPTQTPTPTPTPTPAPVRAPLDAPASGPSLAVGITEPNPNLVATDDVLAVPAPWRRWRDDLARIHPELYRLVIQWNLVQPSPAAPANLALPNAGCMRDKQPCAPYAGVRDQLRALAARQREDGWQALVVFTGTPEWAAVPPRGCPGDEGGGRAPRDLAGVPRAGVRRDRARRRRGRRAALLHALERAEPSVLPVAAAQGVRRARALAGRQAVRAAGARAAGRARRARWRRPAARARRDGGRPRAQLASHVDRRDDPRPAARAGVRGAGLVPARLHRRHRPGRRGQVRAGEPPLPARARDLDHRDRRRPGAGRLLARARDHQRGAGVPAPAPAPARVARGSAGHARRPVHDARGRPVPDRPRHHGPRARPAGAATSGRPGASATAPGDRPPPQRPANGRPGTAARARAS